MQQLMVVIDASPSSWQAAYMAFHLAALWKTRLTGAILMDPLRAEQAHATRSEFETGARAAQIQYDSFLLGGLSRLTDALPADLNGIFFGRPSPHGWLQDDPQLLEIISGANCPIWVVPEQREIHQVLAFMEPGPRGEGVRRFAQYLKRRGSPTIQYLAVADPSKAALREVAHLSMPTDVDHLMLVAAAQHADLLITAPPGGPLPVWELCQRAVCRVVLCPPIG